MTEVNGTKNVLIVTNYRYPNGDAGAIRQHSFAKIFKDLNYNVIVVSLGESTNFNFVKYDGVNHISFRNIKNNLFYKIKNRLDYKKRLKRLLKNSFFDIVLAAELQCNVLLYLKKYAKKNKIKLLYDSVEWYSPEEFKNGKFALAYRNNNNLNTKWIDKQFSVISISSFLENHFVSKGIKAIRVPVIMDVEKISCFKDTDQQKTVFLYAGSPGKKDYLAEIINAFALISKEKLKELEFRLIGIKKEQLVSLCGTDAETIEYLGDSLICLGRVSREEVLKNLSKSDFTVLLRSELQRYAKAGFPTKVVESLSTGTPVITNLTSDLGMYLHDGVNSIISKDDSVKAFSKALERAIELSYEEKQAMYENARKTANENFDYKLYSEKLSQLI